MADSEFAAVLLDLGRCHMRWLYVDGHSLGRCKENKVVRGGSGSMYGLSCMVRTMVLWTISEGMAEDCVLVLFYTLRLL